MEFTNLFLNFKNFEKISGIFVRVFLMSFENFFKRTEISSNSLDNDSTLNVVLNLRRESWILFYFY